MSAVARKLGIAASERGVLACGATTLFLVGWADVQMTNVAETLFLKRVGVAYLPLVFLGNSLLLVGSTFVAGRLAARADQPRLLTVTLVVLAFALLPLGLLVQVDAAAVFTLLLIVAKQLDSIALLVFWVALGGLLHGRQAKRLYAPIAAGATLGAILGSFASGPLGRAFGPAALVPVAAASLLLAALASVPLRRVAPARLAPDGPRAPGAPRRPARRPASRVLWRQGLLVRVLIASAILSGILGPMLYFQFSYVTDAATPGANGEQRLLDLYGRIRGWMNLAVLALQVAGTARLYRWIGVPLAAALSPLVYLVGFVGLSVRLGLGVGLGAFAAANVQDHAVYDPAQRVLLTLFNERIRAAVAGFIDGPAKRAGGALGNLVVLGALALGTPAWVGYAAIPIAAAWFALALGLWRAYPSLLLETLTARGARHGLPLADLIGPATLRLLESSLVDEDGARARAACDLLVEVPPARALGVFTRAAPRVPAARRGLVVDALDRVVRRDPALGPPAGDGARALGALLDDPTGLDVRARIQLVHACARLTAIATDARARARLTRLTADPAPAVAIAARLALLAAGVPAPGDHDLDALLAHALADDDPDVRAVGVEALRRLLLGGAAPEGDARWPLRLALLASGLARPTDRPRAAAALADVAERHGRRLAAQGASLMAHGDDPDARVRTAVARFAGHAGLAHSAPWLVERITARDRGEAAAARDALRMLGPTVTDALLEVLHFGRRSTRLAVLPILREMPVDARTLRLLIDAELEAARRTARQLPALERGIVSDLVLQRLHERIAEAAHTILLLFAALLDEERIARLCRLLARTAPAARERAVLLEALEALLPPERRAAVMALLEAEPRAGAGAAADGRSRDLPAPDQALRAALASDDRLTRAFLRATLDPATLARVSAAAGAPAAERSARASHDAGRDARRPAWTRTGAHAPPAGEAAVLSKVEIVLHLRSLEIFARLTTRQLSELAEVVREETFAPGATVVREGEVDDCMYLIVAGLVGVTKEGRPLAEMGPRGFFGEMAVFDGATRSATVTAVNALRVLRLERHDLFHVMEEQPGIAITICQTLTRRVRELNERVRGLRHD